MKKEDFMNLGLTEEQAEAAATASQQELAGYVTKEQYQGLEDKMAYAAKDHAVDLEIFKAGGKNVKAIKALLDMDKIMLKEDGGLDGLDLDALRERESYLFTQETRQIVGTGFTRGTFVSPADQIAQAFRQK